VAPPRLGGLAGLDDRPAGSDDRLLPDRTSWRDSAASPLPTGSKTWRSAHT